MKNMYIVSVLLFLTAIANAQPRPRLDPTAVDRGRIRLEGQRQFQADTVKQARRFGEWQAKIADKYPGQPLLTPRELQVESRKAAKQDIRAQKLQTAKAKGYVPELSETDQLVRALGKIPEVSEVFDEELLRAKGKRKLKTTFHRDSLTPLPVPAGRPILPQLGSSPPPSRPLVATPLLGGRPAVAPSAPNLGTTDTRPRVGPFVSYPNCLGDSGNPLRRSCGAGEALRRAAAPLTLGAAVVSGVAPATAAGVGTGVLLRAAGQRAAQAAPALAPLLGSQ